MIDTRLRIMASLGELLTDAGLSQYIDRFAAAGFESGESLKSLTMQDYSKGSSRV